MEVEVRSEGSGAFVGSFQRMIDIMGSFGAAATAVGVALVALSVAGMAKAINSSRELAGVQRELTKVTDPATATAMGSALRRMAQEIPLGISRLGDMATTAGRLGIKGVKNIESFTRATAMMGVATTLGPLEAANAFARLSNAMDVPIQEAENMGSAINELSNNVAATSQEIADSMLRAAPAAGTLGVAFSDLAAMTSTLIATGQRARRVGTRLNAAFTMLSQNSDKVAQTLLAVGGESGVLGGKMQDLRGIVVEEQAELRGLQAELNETSSALKGLGDAHDELGDSMKRNRVAIQEIRVAAAKEGRELTDEEKAQIEELRTANQELRLEQMKNEVQQDDLREAQEEQKAAVEDQEQAVASAEETFVGAFQSMVDESPTDAFLQLLEGLNSIESQSERVAIATELFGQSGAKAVNALAGNYDDLRKNMELGETAFSENTSLARELGIEMDSLGSEMSLLGGQVNDLFISAGNDLKPALRTLVETARGGISVFQRVNDAVGGWIPTVILVSGLLTGLTLAGAGLFTLLGGAPAILGAAGAAFTLLTGPIGYAILAITALVTIWTSNVFGIRDKTMAAFGRVREFLVGVLGFLREKVVGPFLGWLRGIWATHGDGIVTDLRATTAAWVGAIRTALGIIREIIQPALDFLQGLWDVFGDYILTSLQAAFAAIQFFVDLWIDAFLTSIRVTLRLLRGDWRGAWELIENFLGRSLDGLVDLVTAWGPKLAEATWNAAKKAAAKLLGPIEGAVSRAQELVNNIPGVNIGGGDDGSSSFPPTPPTPTSTGTARFSPALDTGGTIIEGGLAVLHSGERVVRAAKVRRDDPDDPGAGGVTIEHIEIHAETREGGRAAGRGLKQELRSMGVR